MSDCHWGQGTFESMVSIEGKQLLSPPSVTVPALGNHSSEIIMKLHILLSVLQKAILLTDMYVFVCVCTQIYFI